MSRYSVPHPAPARALHAPAHACLSAVALSLPLAFMLGGCGRGDDAARDDAAGGAAATSAIVVEDDAGREVRLGAPARRIISLVPARTEALLALGAGDRLIARTRYDGDPRIAALPSVGNALNPSLEWLAAQRPDLVIAWADAASRTTIERLAAAGFVVYASRVERLVELDANLRDLGVLLGVPARADSLRAALAAQLDSVRRLVGDRPPRRVLYLIGTDPPFAAGPGTFIDELLDIAGGRNVFGDLRQSWQHVSMEEIVRRQPDVIVVATAESTAALATRLAAVPGWRELVAVRAGAVFAVDADLFNRVGPRTGVAARQLAAILHADAVMPSDATPAPDATPVPATVPASDTARP